MAFFALEIFESDDTLIEGLASSTPWAGLGIDLHWPETVCSWSFFEPPAVALWGNIYVTVTTFRHPEKNSSSEQTCLNNAIIIQRVHTFLLALLLCPNLTQMLLLPSHLCLKFIVNQCFLCRAVLHWKLEIQEHNNTDTQVAFPKCSHFAPLN